MRKIILISLTVFLNLVLFSCTPQERALNGTEYQDCCGDGGNIPPPPPPPPGG
ncbi:hypothetical protein KXJ69_05500 [Aureisphaera sp. CAU 1614]|uniref:Lipoprotein n=1 Tax=Halomarinibacterium sedimenti TaxID=2857106 RepID=A0A9X1JVB8_9FLAO|nr:hypothetical protein [Halomarinibacterium sedimenti]MBW2937550.1 hypothetical protein [Halomarinibacterium sedimenti]